MKPSSNQSGVPDAAVEAASEALCEELPEGLELRGGTWVEDPLADEWADWVFPALAAALPAFTVSIEEEVRERLASDLRDFDAWLSFRPEFAEVLRAFRRAFGTDTSAAASTQPLSTSAGGDQ